MMPWLDLYLLLLAASLAFGAVLGRAAGVAWQIELALVSLAALTLVLAGFAWLVARRGMRPVLLVGGAAPGWGPLPQALDDSWFSIVSCPGPRARACPVLAGDPCPIEEHVVAAMIVREPGTTDAVPPCGPALDVPVLLLEKGSGEAPRVGERIGRVGLARGAEGTVEALRALLRKAGTEASPPIPALRQEART
ncbi:MAG TPA: hypothetical protein VK977_02350 [Actinomycetota bacterium]|nr:hypothetical protein [Actinomycetota bacterium]